MSVWGVIGCLAGCGFGEGGVIRVSRSSAAVVALVVGLDTAGCEGGQPDAEGTPSAGQSSVSESPSPSVLPPVLVSEATPVPADGRVLQRIELLGGPDWLAAGAGAVWVKADDGVVYRLDPATSEVTETIILAEPGPVNLCQGLGADDTAVWACVPDGKVVRIDPANNTVAATVDVGKYIDQGQIQVTFSHAWVLTGDGSTLVGIADDRAAQTFPLGERCQELAATATAIWAACTIEGHALRIDADTGQVTARVDGLIDARAIGASADTVWVGFAGGVARIDEGSATVTAVADVRPGREGGIYATEEAVWVRDHGEFLRRLDPVTGEVLEHLTAPEQSGGSALFAFDSLWTTFYDDHVLYRMSPT